MDVAQKSEIPSVSSWSGMQGLADETRWELVLHAGGPRLSINIGPLAQLNGLVVDNIIKPNIRVMGYVIWLAELSIVVLLGLGLFSRLGGLIVLGVSAQLMIGPTLGRILGLDVLIRRWAVPAAANGNVIARVVKVLS